jgi:hypothetical protein
VRRSAHLVLVLSARHLTLHRRGQAPRSVTITSPDPKAVAAALAELLRERTQPRWLPRATVRVLIGPCLAQIARIEGIPAQLSPTDRRDAVAHVAHVYFLSASEPLATVVGRLDEDGATWAMAIPRDVALVLEEALLRARLRVLSVSPVLDVLAASTDPADGTLQVRDGQVIGLAEVSSRGLARAWRAPSSHAVSAPDFDPRRVSQLAFTTAAARRFGDTVPSLWRSGNNRGTWRLPAAMAIATTVFAAAAPIVRLRVETGRLSTAAGALAERFAAVDAMERRAMDIQRELDEITSFRSRTVALTPVLHTIGTALSDDGSLVTVTLDSSGAQAVVLTPHAADVLKSVVESPGVQRLRLLGPVTRESRTPASPGWPSSGMLSAPPTSVQTPSQVDRVSFAFALGPASTTDTSRLQTLAAKTPRRQ